MKTLREIYQESYNQAVSDGNEKHHSDKGTFHSYIDVYEDLFKPYRHEPVSFLEIGVNYGYSMLTWQNYFTKGTFHGIDVQRIAHHTKGYNYIVENINCTESIKNYLKGLTFDIIIDDGSHLIDDQINALKILYPMLKSGGLYIIEDINDLDATKHQFKEYNPSVYDNRIKQNRWDDVMIIIKK